MSKFDTIMPIRWTDEKKGLAEQVAYDRGMNLSTYVRNLILTDIEKWQKEKLGH